MDENKVLEISLNKLKNEGNLTQDDIKKIIDNSNLYKDNVWIIIILLLFVQPNMFKKEDDK